MDVRWRLPPHIVSAAVVGALVGVVGTLLFATAHAIVIVPIWGRMSSGFVTGPLTGAAAGWALIELVPAVLVVGAWRAATLGMAFGGALWALVTPVTLVGAMLRHSGVAESSEFVEVAVALTVAAASGGVFAWWRSRRWMSTIAGALATCMLTIAMAGPVPIRSSRALGIFLSVLLVTSLAGSLLAVAVRGASTSRLTSHYAEL